MQYADGGIRHGSSRWNHRRTIEVCLRTQLDEPTAGDVSGHRARLVALVETRTCRDPHYTVTSFPLEQHDRWTCPKSETRLSPSTFVQPVFITNDHRTSTAQRQYILRIPDALSTTPTDPNGVCRYALRRILVCTVNCNDNKQHLP